MSIFDLVFWILGEGDDLFGEDEDFEISNTGLNAETDKFDHIVGVLQDILLEPEFES